MKVMWKSTTTTTTITNVLEQDIKRFKELEREAVGEMEERMRQKA